MWGPHRGQHAAVVDLLNLADAARANGLPKAALPERARSIGKIQAIMHQTAGNIGHAYSNSLLFQLSWHMHAHACTVDILDLLETHKTLQKPHAVQLAAGRRAHRLLRALTARSPSFCLTAKQTECSEDAWLIMMTFAFASRTVLKMALAVPCTPTMPDQAACVTA